MRPKSILCATPLLALALAALGFSWGGFPGMADEEAFKVTTLSAPTGGTQVNRFRVTGEEDPARAIFENVDVGIGVPNPVEDLEVAGAVRIGNATGAADGTVRWTGTDFEGRKGGRWVSLTKQGDSPGGSAVYIRFTRATASPGDSDATKDTTVANELGSNYRAATILDVIALMQYVRIDGIEDFVVAGSSNRWRLSDPASAGNPLVIDAVGSTGSGHVAAIHVSAPLMFTRGSISVSDTDANKDALVQGEFGTEYVAATILDVASYHRYNVPDTVQEFTVAGSGSRWAAANPSPATGPLFLDNRGSTGSRPVAAVRKE